MASCPRPNASAAQPDLERSKSTALNSLASQSSQRSYDHTILEFIEWYCSEPRLAFNKTVVPRHRICLEQAHDASSTINLRLAAVRRLAYEAADAGLLSPDLAAGIRRVKGVKQFRVRVGNWLTAGQGRRLLGIFDQSTLRGCGLRRAEVRICSNAKNTGYSPIPPARVVCHVRTVSVPLWIADALRTWMTEAKITEGPIFRAINKAGRIAVHGFSPKVIWGVVKQACQGCNLGNVPPP